MCQYCNSNKEVKMRNIYKGVVSLALITIGLIYDEYREFSYLLNAIGLILIVLVVFLFAEKNDKSE